MNRIDKITERIKADAENEVAQIRARSLADCLETENRYNAQAKKEYENLVAAGKQAAQQSADRVIRTANTEAKKQILAFKQEMVKNAFEQSVSKLLSLPEDRYVELLAFLCVKAARTGNERLIFSPKDREKYGELVASAANELLKTNGKPAKLTLDEETREISGGVIVTDGQIEVNCDFKAMAEAQKNALKGPVAEILFD